MSRINHCVSAVNPPAKSDITTDAALFQEAQARITFASTVASCLDTLKVSFWVDWLDSDILEQLEDAKLAAQATKFDPDEPIELAGHTFNCSRVGTKLFTYRLVKGDVKFLFSSRSPNTVMPNTRLEIGSMSCWAPGYQQIYDEFIKFVELLGGVIKKERVSEAHLCADFIGVAVDDVPIRTEAHWITLAHNFKYISNRMKFSLVSWGSDVLMLRIYWVFQSSRPRIPFEVGHLFQ